MYNRRQAVDIGVRGFLALVLGGSVLEGCLENTACVETTTGSTMCVDMSKIQNAVAYGVVQPGGETIEGVRARLMDEFGLDSRDLLTSRVITVDEAGAVQSEHYATKEGDRSNSALLTEGSFVVLCRDMRYEERIAVEEGMTFQQVFPLATIGPDGYGVVVVRGGKAIDLGKGGEFNLSFKAQAGDEYVLVKAADLRDYDPYTPASKAA